MREHASQIEMEILAKAVQKLNTVYMNGRGESLTEDELAVFSYWKKIGKVRAIAPAPYGEIYEIADDQE